MKIKDLMMGDWVFIKDYPIKALPQKVKLEHFVRSLVESLSHSLKRYWRRTVGFTTMKMRSSSLKRGLGVD